MFKFSAFVKSGPTPKWISVNELILTFLHVNNLSSKCIVYMNDSVAYFYFYTIFIKICKWKNTVKYNVTIYFCAAF